MDKDTQNILSQQKLISDVLGMSGWKLIEDKFNTKIQALRDAFEVDDSTPEKMLVDLQSRKACAILMQEWMREIVSSKDVIMENKEDKNSIIFKVE